MSQVVGVLLVLLGIGSYWASDRVSVTALIPAAFGVAFVILGAVGNARPNARKHVMHAAMTVALLGIAGSAGGLFAAGRAVGSGEPVTMAAGAKSAMAVMLIVYLALGINSFIAARRARSTNG